MVRRTVRCCYDTWPQCDGEYLLPGLKLPQGDEARSVKRAK